jgi:hypothetical protein
MITMVSVCLGSTIRHVNLSRNFAGHHLVHVAPDPALPRLDGTHERMLRPMIVFGGVLVLGRVAAANLPAGETHAKVNPRVTFFDALFTLVLLGFSNLNLIEVGAFVWH